jgi:hypothetical protein
MSDGWELFFHLAVGSKRSERRLCRRNSSWGEGRKGGEAPLRGDLTLRSLDAKRWRG